MTWKNAVHRILKPVIEAPVLAASMMLIAAVMNSVLISNPVMCAVATAIPTIVALWIFWRLASGRW
jgi:hypothetical protein